MFGSGRNLLVVGVTAITAGKGLYALCDVRCIGGNYALIKVMRCGLTFITDAETDVGIVIKLVDHPLAPLVLCERGNIFRIEISTLTAGVFFLSHSFVRRRLSYFAVIKLMICGFRLIAAAVTAVSISVIIGSPISELMVCGRNVLCSCMHTDLTSKCLNTLFLTGGLCSDFTVIPLVRKGFELVTVIVHAIALVVFVTVGIPIRPSTFVHQFVNRLCLDVRANTASVGLNAFFPFGRLFGYNTVIKVVIVSLITVTNRAGHLVSVFVHTYPIAPFVTAKVLCVTIFSLTMANMGVYAIVSPIAKVVIKSGNGFCLGSSTIGAGICSCTVLGAGRSFGLYAVIPVVRLCFFRGTAF
jgi:hypothetical protein